MSIDRFVVESTNAQTELCDLGFDFGADKSPYNRIGHRHPYTGVYTLLFAPLKTRAVRIAEIGVAGGASAAMWSAYFTHPDAQIRMFDRDENFLAHCRQRVPDSRLTAEIMDVGVDGDVERGLGDLEYDVIIDDSSHDFAHQVRIVREALPKLKRGGMLIIEDVFKATPLEDYEKALAADLATATTAYFVDCEHQWRWSPGWDNDRLLVIVR